MSSIATIRDKNGRGIRYRVRYRTPDGASRSRTFDRKADAEAFIASTEVRKMNGEFVDPVLGRMTFGAFAAEWLKRKRDSGLKPTTVATFESHLNAHLLPRWGRVELRAITRDDVEAFAHRLCRTMKPSTAQAVTYTLAAVLKAAVRVGRIPNNPASDLRLARKRDRRADPGHIGNVAANVEALADAMPARWRGAVLLMASTGLRLGECLGLTVDRVDFLRRTVRIDRQLANTTKGGGFGTPKTGAGVRTIPVPQVVVEMLAAHLAEFPAGEHGLMFTDRRGGPVTRSSWSDAYRAACASVGIDGRTRTHDLRHVAASALIAAGLPVTAVQHALGHSTPAETLTVYAHFFPTDEERTREAIERVAAGFIRRTG